MMVMTAKEIIVQSIEAQRSDYVALSGQIWDFAELALREVKSAGLLMDFLRENGFSILSKAGGIETAFLAEWGNGAPVIGFLAEYDALAGLSQEANVACQKPIVKGAPGHGCGHHVLGVGAVAAAAATAHCLKKLGLPGTVRLYGCPAEEGVGGKVLMAKAGLFDDVDAALTWHPTCYNSIWSCNFLATRSITFQFSGILAHSTMQGHVGRSALEAVELTSVGANYLRGHLERDVFLNYAVLDAGGTAPNIIPNYAEVLYMLRAPSQKQVHDAAIRLYDVAYGAARMTGTTVKPVVNSGLSELIPNRTLERAMHRAFEQIGIEPVSDEDMEFATQIHASFPDNAEESTFSNLRYLYGETAEGIIEKIRGKLVDDVLYPYTEIHRPKFGSTDVCDVSWFTPTAQLTAACYAKDTPGHSWQIVAQGKRALCMNGMLTAAKVMALTAMELYSDRALMQKVRSEFHEKMRGKTYICPVPDAE